MDDALKKLQRGFEFMSLAENEIGEGLRLIDGEDLPPLVWEIVAQFRRLQKNIIDLEFEYVEASNELDEIL